MYDFLVIFYFSYKFNVTVEVRKRSFIWYDQTFNNKLLIQWQTHTHLVLNAQLVAVKSENKNNKLVYMREKLNFILS